MPVPMRMTIKVGVLIRCSTPDCIEGADLPGLPFVCPEVDVWVLDEREFRASLPAGWILGAIKQGSVVLAPGSGAPRPPMPVAFCPTCAPRVQGSAR